MEAIQTEWQSQPRWRGLGEARRRYGLALGLCAFGSTPFGITNHTSKSVLGYVLFERKPTGSDQCSMFTVDAGVGRNPSPAGPMGRYCGGIQSDVKAR